MSTHIEQTFCFLAHDVARLMAKKFDHVARDLGLSRAQARVIGYTIRNEGIHQAGLAELLEVEPITLARLLERMEIAGWIERRPDPADRRARCVYVTDKARQMYARMREIGAKVQAHAMAGLEPHETALLMTLMERIHANLSDREIEAGKQCLPDTRPSRRLDP